MGAVSAHQDKLVIFSYTPKAIRAAVTAHLVKSYSSNEGRVPLTPSNHSLFPGRKYCNKVILPARLRDIS